MAIMSFVGRDVFGNNMHEDAICSYFTHTRFIMYFNFVFTNPSSQSDLKKV